MKIVILADSISTQSAGIHYYGKQFIENIVLNYPDNEYLVVSTKPLNFKNTQDVVVPNKGNSQISLRLRQLFKLPKIVRKMNPDIVIELAHFGPFRLPKSIKRITVIHDLTPITHPQYHDKPSTVFHKLLMPRILKKAHSVICNSHATKASIASLYPQVRDKIFVSYPKIDSKFHNSSVVVKGDYFITIGTMEPRKNYPNLLLAYDLYKQNGGESKLVIIGSKGWGMKDFTAQLNNITHKADVLVKHDLSRKLLVKYVSEAKAFISVSHYEGFGLPVLEAMSYHLPLLLSGIEVYKELASECALYFNQKDVQSIAASMTEFEKGDKSEYENKSKERYNAISAIEFSQPYLA